LNFEKVEQKRNNYNLIVYLLIIKSFHNYIAQTLKLMIVLKLATMKLKAY